MNVPAHGIKGQVAYYAQLLHERGWVANHDGNVSVRGEPGEYHCTPSAWSKRRVEAHDVLTVDGTGKVRVGRHKVFGEWHLHRAVYLARPDAQAVIHAHPPTAGGFAVAHKALPNPNMGELVVSLGAHIPMVAFALPKSEAQDQGVAAAALTADVALLAGHGVLCWGDDLEQAYLRMEMLEHWAKMALVALQLGGPVPLAAQDLLKLQAARTAAGLGAAGRTPLKR